MAINNFSVKFSGTVSYDDNSHGSFESTATWAGEFGGLIASHNTVDSKFHFSQLFTDKAVGMQAMLDILGGSITITPATASPDRTVSNFVAEISGLVSYDDGTANGMFVAQWVDGVVNVFPNDSPTHWAAIAGDANANAFLTSALEKLVGSGNATVTT